MRTTVTLDPDTEQLIRQRMAQRGLSFKQALNDSIRDGNLAPTHEPSTRTAHLGLPTMNLTHALQLAAALEDADLIARLHRGS